ncbi:hypothetical protein C805_00402 [Eubacterium sp. 14-2]|uniref:PDDEXK nuclease domain-containing protein n=1 Tax=Eubacterium sp. 14-2 TaxID=1235790 RepID=UPI0003409BC2|nr:PDDEXK nuclease domain-containing protein [Eubacterium sp. 14-2]EOT28260.1 hypothetical protein C805_00402 [Eubacterium sp. 14-2]
MANLKNCSQFYLAFSEESYGFAKAGKIPWSHLRSIMRISDEEERNFYLNEVLTENWSVRVLERNIKSGYYKRMFSAQLPDKENKVLEFVKDPFVFEFMSVTSNYQPIRKRFRNSYYKLSSKISTGNVKRVSFVGRQMRMCTETTDFYIDLVFYDIWCCFVPESKDFVDKMGDCGPGSIRRIKFVTFCSENS